jgi:hypothetical protein
VGIFTRARDALAAAGALEASNVTPHYPGAYPSVASPIGPHMPVQTLSIAALFPGGIGIVTRDQALSLPPVAKGRDAIQAIATLPLEAFRGEGRIEPQPAWLNRSAYGSPWLRLQATVDDLIFDGTALWWLDRGARTTIIDAHYVERDEWSIDPDGRILVQGDTVDVGQVCLFSGPIPGGLLTRGRVTITAGLDLESTWAGRVASPAPLVELHQTTDDVLEDDEIAEMLANWSAARRSLTGAVAYTPASITAIIHGQSMSDLLIAARNQLAVDIASHMGLPVSTTNASLATSTLTYKTQATESSALYEALIPWQTAITARLSEDDITPAGTRTAFDNSRYAAPTGAQTED